MLPNMKSYEQSIHTGVKLTHTRRAEARGERSLPSGTVVVSADNHWSLAEDIFFERFPDHLRDRAPRFLRDSAGACHWVVDGKSLFPASLARSLADFERVPGCTELEPRLRDLDIEGVDKELNFGNGILAFLGFPDLEVREWVFRIYNQHLSEVQTRAPGRFYGVGLINYWDMSKAAASIAELKELGLKTYLLPQNPMGADSRALNYCLPEMEPLWLAAEEAALPVCFHVGEFFREGPGGVGTAAMVQFGAFRKNLGELIFGGIFDRHPRLHVVFVEAEINWVPGALQTADMTYECYRDLIEPKIRHHPVHYWQNNCFATFTSDPVGLKLLDQIGVDRVMWSADYPHPESMFGRNWTSMQAVVDAVSEDDARKMLGGTAMKLFNL
jgi:predicted TIM-barrel fold metal-dependent hydrolase